MAEPTPGAPAPAPPPTPPAPAGDENSVIRSMREQIEAANRQAREAAEKAAQFETKLKEHERAKLDEVDRLKAEKADFEKQIAELAPIRDEHGRFQSAFEELYKGELAAVPDDKRPTVEALSKSGAWPDRLEALRSAKGLLGAPPVAPTSAGTTTKPGSTPSPPADPPQPKPLDPKNPPRWGDVLKRPSSPGTV